MKIALLTPLYPPDIDQLALYTKELASRIGKNHEVTVVAYGYLPEPIDGVRNVSVDKRKPLAVRLFQYTRQLNKIARDSDLVYAQNGASIELPLVLVSVFRGIPYVLRLGDKEARSRAKKSVLLGLIERIATRNAHTVITSTDEGVAGVRTMHIADPLPRPEIHPFADAPVDMTQHETSWEEHVALLEQLFGHGTR